MKRRTWLALLAFMWTLAGLAGETATFVKNRIKADKPVVLNRWHADLAKCKSYAEKNGVPLIAVWSNGDACGHCVAFESSCNHSVFKEWMATSGCVFLFVHSGDKGGGQGSKPYNFCYGGQGFFPLIRIYWYKDGKKKYNTYTDGDKLDGQLGGKAGAKKAVAWLKKKLKGMGYKYTPAPETPKYTGGGFDTVESEQARLEVEVGNTKPVEVPLSRAGTVSNKAGTNSLVVVQADGATVTNTIVWAANEDEKSVVVDTSSLTSAGEQVTLILLDANGKAVATNHVTAVAPVENSAKNPYWIGEKTEETLEWGEWTMDIDVATNKVKAYNVPQSGSASLLSARPRLMNASSDKAHTLVLVEGSLWCGDCSAAVKNFFGDPRFKDWARDNKVALVAIDIPSDPTDSSLPSLLNYNVTTNGDRYVTANFTPNYSNEAMRVQSGAGYLSRHGISREAAKAVAERNAALVGTSIADGGWNTPDRMLADKTKVRTGVPVLLVLRDDGTIAGRFSQYAVSGPKEFEPGVLTRLEEMFDQIGDANEEANDYRETTSEEIGKRAKVEGKTISFTDAADVYKLKAEETKGRRMKFSVTSESSASLEVKLLAYAANGTNSTLLASASGMNLVELTTPSVVNSANCFLSVGRGTGDPAFAHTSTTSTVCEYALESDFVVEPTETVADNQITIDDGVNAVTVALVSNQTYRITNLDTANAGNLAALAPWDGGTVDSLYVAQVTDDVRLTLAAPATDVQKWNPGKVGFAAGSAVVSETAGIYTLRLARTGGVSGTATMVVTTNVVRSSALENLIELPEGFSDMVTWEDGDGAEKTLEVWVLDNQFADGDQQIYFDAECGGDAAPGLTSFRLTLRDNDKRVPGRLEISDARPAFAKPMTVFARAGDTMDVILGRVDGADGTLSATLSASAGTLDETEFTWLGRDKGTKEPTLTLPDTVGKKVTVTLTPKKGTAVNADKRILTVNLLDPSVPGFETAAVGIPAWRYMPIDEWRVKLDDKATEATTVKKFSGTLAAGLKWSFDKENREIVISGVPTKAGSTTATFRAYNGSTAGLTVAVSVDVFDPVVEGGGTLGTTPINPSVAKTRTFKDVPVVDETSKRLLGMLTLTLPRSGRASAKYRTVDDGTVSLSCANWDAFAEFGAGCATLRATLGGVSGTNEYTLVVMAQPEGTVDLTMFDPLHSDGVEVNLSNFWSNANPATDFKGYYTVSLPRKELLPGSGAVLASGDGYVTLKMNTTAAINAGSVTYAGLMPNGKGFSGATTLAARDWLDNTNFLYWARAIVPMLSVSTVDTLAGAVQITPGAADGNATNDVAGGVCLGRCWYRTVRKSVANANECDLLWRHVENDEAISCEATLSALGTYYNSAEDFKSCCDAALSTSKLKLFALQGEALDEEITDDLGAGALELDAPKTVTTVTVTFAKATKKAKVKTSAIASADKKLSFTLGTGLVSGTFVLPYEKGNKTLTYKGIVMPGWGDGNCGECNPAAGAIDTSRPFISGTAWFNDTYEYEDVLGRIRKVTVRRSVPFSVGVQAGK